MKFNWKSSQILILFTVIFVLSIVLCKYKKMREGFVDPEGFTEIKDNDLDLEYSLNVKSKYLDILINFKRLIDKNDDDINTSNDVITQINCNEQNLDPLGRANCKFKEFINKYSEEYKLFEIIIEEKDKIKILKSLQSLDLVKGDVDEYIEQEIISVRKQLQNLSKYHKESKIQQKIQQKLKQLQTNIKKQNDKINKIKRTTNNITSTINNLKQKDSDTEEKVSKLLDKTSNQNKEITEEINNITSTINNLEKKDSDTEEKVSKLLTKIDNQNNKITEEINKITSTTNNITSTINNLEKKDSDTEEKVSKLLDKIDNQNKEIKKEINKITSTTNNLEKKDSDTEEEISKLLTRIDNQNEKINGITYEIEVLNETIQGQNTKYAELPPLQEISELQELIEEINSKILEYDNKLNELRDLSESNDRDAEIKKIQNYIVDLDNEKKELNKRINEIQEENNFSSGNIENLDGTNENLGTIPEMFTNMSDVKKVLLSDMVLKTVLFASLFFLLTHKDMQPILKKLVKNLPKSVGKVVHPAVLFGMLYYLLELFI